MNVWELFCYGFNSGLLIFLLIIKAKSFDSEHEKLKFNSVNNFSSVQEIN